MSGPLKIYVIHAHQDDREAGQLRRHIDSAEGLASIGDVPQGGAPDQVARDSIHQADRMVILMSADLFASVRWKATLEPDLESLPTGRVICVRLRAAIAPKRLSPHPTLPRDGGTFFSREDNEERRDPDEVWRDVVADLLASAAYPAHFAQRAALPSHIPRPRIEKNIRAFIHAERAATRPKTVLLVTGDGGRGKSWLLDWIAAELAEKSIVARSNDRDESVNRPAETERETEREAERIYRDLKEKVKDQLGAVDSIFLAGSPSEPDERLLDKLATLDRRLALAGGQLLWLIDDCDRAPQVLNKLLALGKELSFRNASRTTIVVAIRKASADQRKSGEHVHRVEVGPFEEGEDGEVVAMLVKTLGVDRPEANKIALNNPIMVEPWAWKVLHSQSAPTVREYLENGRGRTLASIVEMYVERLESDELKRMRRRAQRIIEDRTLSGCRGITDWQLEIEVGWELVCGGGVPGEAQDEAIIQLTQDLSKASTADQIYLERAIGIALRLLVLRKKDRARVRKFLHIAAPADGHARTTRLAALAAQACVDGVKQGDDEVASAVAGWFDFGWHLLGGLPDSGRLALAEVAIDMDMALWKREGAPATRAAGERSILARAILSGDATLYAALCGVQRVSSDERSIPQRRAGAGRGDQYIDVVDDAMSGIVSRAMVKGIRSSWRVLLLGRHVPKLAVFSTFLVSPVGSRDAGDREAIVERVKNQWLRLRDSKVTSPIVLRALALPIAMAIVRSLPKLPRHNPWRYPNEVASFFCDPINRHRKTLEGIINLGRSLDTDEPASLDDLARETRSIIDAEGLPFCALGATIIESVWGMAIDGLDVMRTARSLKGLLEYALSPARPERAGYAQSCLFIMYRLLSAHAPHDGAASKTYADALAEYRYMLDRWLKTEPPGLHRTRSNKEFNVQIFHLFRYTRAAWSADASRSTSVFEGWTRALMRREDQEGKPDEATAATLLEEIFYLGYELNLWEQADELLEVWREELKAWSSVPRKRDGARRLRGFYEAHLRRLHKQRADSVHRIYRHIRLDRAQNQWSVVSSFARDDRLFVDESPTPEHGLTCPMEDTFYYFLRRHARFRRQACEILAHALEAEEMIDWFQFLVQKSAEIIFGSSEDDPLASPRAG